jgi:hypothetical protein
MVSTVVVCNLCCFVVGHVGLALCLEAAQRRGDFVRAYEQLSAARAACERARQRYDRSVHLYTAALDLHREANGQLGLLKERFVEVNQGSWCSVQEGAFSHIDPYWLFSDSAVGSERGGRVRVIEE